MSRTIAALATAPGIAGLAVIRVSGEDAVSIVDKAFKGKNKLVNCDSHTIHFGSFYHNDILLDTVTAMIYKSPHSYTGENVVEIGCHGGNYIANQLLSALYDLGCMIPDPGEFTKRAFLNGKLDLTQVEAVSDIIHSTSTKGAITSARQLQGKFTDKLSNLREQLLEAAGLLELELDFSEEDLELIPKNKILTKLTEVENYCLDLINTHKGSTILKSGFQVAIVGFPNAGKSTLFNRFAGKERAIVSEIEGTTRDYIEEYFYLDSIPVKLIDTAGIRNTDNTIEIQGIKLVESVMDQADIIIVLNDSTLALDNSNELFNEVSSKYKNVIEVHNKVDLVNESIPTNRHDKYHISAKDGSGINQLKNRIVELAHDSTDFVSDALINQRHKDLLEQTIRHIELAKDSLNNGMENEIIAIDVRKATKYIGELTGESWNEEVLDKIFSGFCIGK